MRTNLGFEDRCVRACIGALMLLGLYVSPVDVFTSPALYYGAIVLAVMALLNSITGLCFIFRLIGLNSCPRSDDKNTSL